MVGYQHKPKLIQGGMESTSDTIAFNLKTQRGLTKNTFLKEGEMYVVPKNTEHCPVAKEEVWVMLIESKNTKHTDNTDDTK